MRKWKEDEEIGKRMRKWKENEEMETPNSLSRSRTERELKLSVKRWKHWQNN